MKYLFNDKEISQNELKNYRPLEYSDDLQTILLRELTNEEKIEQLTNWFDNYFDKQLNQSLWQDDFTVSHDDYFDKNYASIDELKAQAKTRRALSAIFLFSNIISFLISSVKSSIKSFSCGSAK